MSDINNILTGLKIPAQIPLDAKLYSASQSVLTNLGTDNNLAYTYYSGMIVYCVQEKTRWEWREVVGSEEGLLPSNFQYPTGLFVFGIDYSNKIYNFFEIIGNTIPVVQDNFVRTLEIQSASLPNPYTTIDICTYILSLPEEDRTILETDSKWNVVIKKLESILIIEIYEIINIGKGIINFISSSNLLRIEQNVSEYIANNMDSLLPYKSYIAILTQEGTTAPNAQVVFNNTGITFTYTRLGEGEYHIVADTLLPTTYPQKIVPRLTNGYCDGVNGVAYDNDGVGLRIFCRSISSVPGDQGQFRDGTLFNDVLEIRIYN